MERLGVVAGQTVAGKFLLEGLLGHGGMGSVWRAQHLELSSPVALKILKPQVAENPNSLARFLREAKAAARLRSPHVVQILDHGMDEGLAYIAMELLDGESLQSRLVREAPLEPSVTATVVTHVARAIGRAHAEGIVHRDLKPENVFLVPNEDELVVKVLDFGIAKSSISELNTTGSPETKTGALLGTPFYMSPEQAAGDKSVDHRSDLWALGVIAFECICGRRPFQSEALGDLVLRICVKPLPIPSAQAEVPTGFDDWFAKAVARDPEQRFQSAQQMAAELRTVLVAGAPSRAGAAPSPGSSAPAPTSDPDLRSLPESTAVATLDPLSSTTVPGRRRMVVGAAVVAGTLAAGAAAAWLLLAPGPATTHAGDGDAATEAAAETATPEPLPA
ncbi:MAG: serine/threonine protein kinase, partial [Deltaproteobacteria bacterium]|nr:serine/threonine protein kinase [Deltaproteobacteria bacterium]MBW2534918.1 serine/threonine protein kinase [Deltaproteobacteria bacterium]